MLVQHLTCAGADGAAGAAVQLHAACAIFGLELWIDARLTISALFKELKL